MRGRGANATFEGGAGNVYVGQNYREHFLVQASGLHKSKQLSVYTFIHTLLPHPPSNGLTARVLHRRMTTLPYWWPSVYSLFPSGTPLTPGCEKNSNIFWVKQEENIYFNVRYMKNEKLVILTQITDKTKISLINWNRFIFIYWFSPGSPPPPCGCGISLPLGNEGLTSDYPKSVTTVYLISWSFLKVLDYCVPLSSPLPVRTLPCSLGCPCLHTLRS